MPSFNMAATLEKSVESCLAQTFADFELFLIDDGSAPAAAELASHLAERDVRLRYRRIQHSGNPGVVRNVGLSMATGDFVQFLDADDLIAPEKLAVQVAVLRGIDHTAVAYSDYTMFWDTGGQWRLERLGPPDAEHWPRSLAKQFSLYTVLHRFLFPRQVLLSHGGFDERMTHAEDLDLWLRLLIRGVPFVYQARTLAYYRQHTSHSLRDADGEVRGRKQAAANCRAYLADAGLTQRYATDLAYLDALAARPAWAFPSKAEYPPLRAGDEASREERGTPDPVQPELAVE